MELLENPPDDIDWLLLTPFLPYALEFYEALVALSMSRRIGIAGFADLPVQGYLIGYGPNMDATAKQAAYIVDRILRGAHPADLPVQIAENYLTVNLEAAEAIGFDFSVSILRQADTIVRPGYFDQTVDENSDD
ncbi:MAG: hypothetical protein JXB47_07195 [Anaerolineae bacterium]|nr:hypothetical protein [Anaerolineae bacterium]